MKIFIGGAKVIHNLEKPVAEKLESIRNKNYTILVGDCDGVDKAVQKYYLDCKYENIIVYASNGKTRNNLGNWPVEKVRVPDNIKGFNFYAAKDDAMAEDADYGFMIWNGDSRGTLNNIISLLKREKKTVVYFAPQDTVVNIDSYEKLDKLMGFCSDNAKKFYEKSCQDVVYLRPQISLFEESVVSV